MVYIVHHPILPGNCGPQGPCLPPPSDVVLAAKLSTSGNHRTNNIQPGGIEGCFTGIHPPTIHHGPIIYDGNWPPPHTIYNGPTIHHGPTIYDRNWPPTTIHNYPSDNYWQHSHCF